MLFLAISLLLFQRCSVWVDATGLVVAGVVLIVMLGTLIDAGLPLFTFEQSRAPLLHKWLGSGTDCAA